MKPHRLSLTAFGPYPGTVEVDFDDLAPHGLFLLHGPTGAGKTSLLDGLCFALYGSLPGLRTAKRLRSDHSSAERLCSVTLEATVAGRRIRITRRPEQERPKKRGEGLTKEQTYVLLEELVGGEWLTRSQRADEVGEEIAQLMGMSAEQFAQVVLLPQGRFAEFLHASSDERTKLLEQLFDTHRFRSVEEWLAARRRQTAQALDIQERTISELTARFSEAAGLEISGDTVSWAISVQSTAADAVHQTEMAAAAATQEAQLRKAEREATEAAMRATTAHRAATARLAELEREASALAETRVELEAAVRAEPARLLAKLARSAQRSLADLVDRRTTAFAAVGIEEGARADDLRGRAGEAMARMGALVALRPQAGELAKAEADLHGVEATLAQAEHHLTVAHRDRIAVGGRLLARAERLQASFVAAEQELTSARASERRIREARLEGMGAELAAALSEGEPCPVCGSAEHPSPAKPAGAQVSLDEEKAASAHVQAAESRVRSTGSELEVLTVETSRLGADLAPSTTRVEESASDLAASLAEVMARISKLTTAVAATKERAAGMSERVSVMREELASAVGSHPDLEAAIAHESGAASCFAAAAETCDAVESAATTASKAEATLMARLPEIGVESVEALLATLRDDEWREVTQAKVDAHCRELDFARRTLSELGDTPLGGDVAAATEASRLADDHLRSAQAAHTLAVSRLRALDRLLHPLLDAAAQAEPLREERRLAKELADLAGGEGSNVYRMRLSTYVLAARLEAVAAAASEKLERMTGGRFTLEHTDERAGRSRGGLGLVVNDAHTGHTRATSTLSGGETFMASLALALGLAEVVGHESGGNPIEALFVDEGFGTLDDETLEQVMDILDSLREGGRMVGVVSHVADLRQRIRAQIKVTRGASGSTLEVLSA